MTKPIKRIAISGGAGQIAYQALFRIASGDLLGKDQPIALHILEIPEALKALEGIKMELEDCANDILKEIIITADPYEAFQDIDYALLIGSKPRGPGMERGDLLTDNGKIFIGQGDALNEAAKKDAKVLVVGNPCNTNCLIALHHAPRLNPNNFYAMMRLDQNRATAHLAKKAGVLISDVSNVVVWGNHSSTQVPDFYHAKINGKPATDVIKDLPWLEKEFLESVRKRGAAIIQARGKSSAASAAHAMIDTIHDLERATSGNNWYSVARLSNGNPYGIEDDLIFSFPSHTVDDQSKIVHGLDINSFLKAQITFSEKELLEERDLIKHMLKKG